MTALVCAAERFLPVEILASTARELGLQLPRYTLGHFPSKHTAMPGGWSQELAIMAETIRPLLPRILGSKQIFCLDFPFPQGNILP
jgi:hypothetical protein